MIRVEIVLQNPDDVERLCELLDLSVDQLQSVDLSDEHRDVAQRVLEQIK